MANIPPQGYEKLSGSEHKPPTNAHLISPADPNQPIEVSLYLRVPSTNNLINKISEQIQRQSPPLSREEYIASESAALTI